MESSDIKIHVLHCGMVHTTKYLPFGNGDAPLFKVAGFGVPQKDWCWMPVSSYYIEHPKGKILVDTGWHRRMSPDGVLDKRAQIKDLGYMLYRLNQGYTPKWETVDEQLTALGIQTSSLDYVLLTHLDCDHACGVEQVKDAKHILVAEEEIESDLKFSPVNKIRFKKHWWENVELTRFPWSGSEGPFRKSYDLFDDGSVKLINIPGHTAGLFAVKITGNDGKFVLITSDGAYSSRSWIEMILPGIAENRKQQELSLEWIKEQASDKNCVECLANHDPQIKPHIITL